ncbi:MAG: bifunctional glutamate N-acetyltransferase/amino-acid acetyltransferase ArgJ [Proteocatella sp.]
MKIIENKNISDVSGFKVSGVKTGVKVSGKFDMSLIYSEIPAIAAATFTKNKTKAAPVKLSMEHIKSENTQAIIINSGNANACTGKDGLDNAYIMTEQVSNLLGIDKESVLVCSTGIIGIPLPMDKITKGIKLACEALCDNDGDACAKGILTTDSFVKKVTVQVIIDDKLVTLSGIAKGSGMIHPNMGTMISLVATDASISKNMLDSALKYSVEDTYNMVSVDGDTSTNDTCIVMANGCAKNSIISDFNADYTVFKTALDYVNEILAISIAKDGEGATKLIETTVVNAKTVKDAKLCAKSVICSSLVKTAMFGGDANWGRILCALGYSTGEFSPDKVDIFFKSKNGEIQVAKDGMGIDFDKAGAKEILDDEYVNIYINLKDGEMKATSWGCDLSYDYVKINGCYST